jgi:glycosyltransferase involved in cell wall biosynthesis
MADRTLAIGCDCGPLSGGGIVSFVRDLVNELRHHRGIRVLMVAPDSREMSWSTLADGCFPTDQHSDPRQVTVKLAGWLEANGVQAVINNDNPFVQALAPALTVPLISIGHYPTRNIATLACHNKKYVDYVCAISWDMWSIFTSKFGVERGRCPIVFTGVAPGLVNVERRPASGRRRQAVFLGGWQPQKGADLVLNFIRSGIRLGDDWAIEWIGGGMPIGIKDLVTRDHGVDYFGTLDRAAVMERLRSADVLLFPSREEGCPMALLEAMALGVIPIAVDGAGAMRSIIRNGIDGFMTSERKWVDDATAHLTRLAHDDALRRRISAAARQRIAAEFTSAHVADRLLDLLQSPTVPRSRPAERIQCLRWHRPIGPRGKAPLLDRFCYRFGFLRRAGEVAVERKRERGVEGQQAQGSMADLLTGCAKSCGPGVESEPCNQNVGAPARTHPERANRASWRLPDAW